MGWGWDYVANLAGKSADAGGAVVSLRDAGVATVDGFHDAVDRVETHMTSDVRPQGTNGQDIYQWFHHGKGTGSIDEAVAGWDRVSQHHADAVAAVNDALAKLRSAWQGVAAGTAETGAERLRQAADVASQHAALASGALQAQSSGFHDTKNKVVDVSVEPPKMSIMAPVNPVGPVNYATEAGAYQDRQETNRQALSGYGATTRANSGNVPAFEPPAHPGDIPARPVGSFDHPTRGEQAPAGTEQSSVDTSGKPPAHGDGPASTASSWQEQDQRPGDSQGVQPMQGAGIAAGAASAAAGGSAILGGTLLGDRAVERNSALTGSGPGGAGAGSRSARGDAAGAPMRGKKDETDQEHERPEYLVEADSGEAFGSGGNAAPPLLGEPMNPESDDESRPAEEPRADPH
jgi:hypothetical protein